MVLATNTVTWDEILNALRSDKYIQSQGALCRITSEGVSYCPLGLIDMLSGSNFELHGNDDVACNDSGETHLPDPELLEELGLNQLMTEEEFALVPEYAASMRFYYEGVVERYTAIAYMNDHVGLKFEKIADEIERLGWNAS